MPGGRLSGQDRRQIAEGLANGLTYTDIAARLHRPISTVSREVMRNGGPGHYQAGQAQQATQKRARRRKPASGSAQAKPAAGDIYGRDPDAVQSLEEQFTEIMVKTGLPRMTARVLTCLYLTDSGSLTAAELVQRLGVSAASVSKAIGELDQQELIRRDRDPRRRRDRYTIDADIWFQGWLASARQNAALSGLARQGAGILGAATPAGARMHDIGEFFEYVGKAMVQAAEHWQQIHVARHATGSGSKDEETPDQSDL